MPAILPFPIYNLLSQFAKHEPTENRRGGGNGRSQEVITSLIIAVLTLLLAIMSYRHPRFGRSASSSSLNACPTPSSLSLIILIYFQSRNQLQPVPRTPLPNLSTTIPPADSAIVNHVFIYNNYSNAPYAGANLSTFSYQNNGISKGDMRVTWVGASPEPSGRGL